MRRSWVRSPPGQNNKEGNKLRKQTPSTEENAQKLAKNIDNTTDPVIADINENKGIRKPNNVQHTKAGGYGFFSRAPGKNKFVLNF